MQGSCDRFHHSQELSIELSFLAYFTGGGLHDILEDLLLKVLNITEKTNGGR